MRPNPHGDCDDWSAAPACAEALTVRHEDPQSKFVNIGLSLGLYDHYKIVAHSVVLYCCKGAFEAWI